MHCLVALAQACVQTVIRVDLIQVQLIFALILTYALTIVQTRHVNVAPRIILARTVNVGVA